MQVFSDAGASKYVSGIGVHWYIDEYSPVVALDYTHFEFPDKFLLATEACVKGYQLGVWEHAQMYASDILDVSIFFNVVLYGLFVHFCLCLFPLLFGILPVKRLKLHLYLTLKKCFSFHCLKLVVMIL